MLDGRPRIIYHEHSGDPVGIRDDSGYLLFFRELQKWPEQPGRYEKDKERIVNLAKFILESLTPTEEESEEDDAKSK